MAVEVARRVNGVVINFDAMQVYADLHIITARPTDDEQQGIPHALYGVLPARERCNVGMWVELAIPVIDDVLSAGKTPILVGGTGMYLKAMMEGLSITPDVPDSVRQETFALIDEIGQEAFYERLVELDPKAAQLNVNDSQRTQRAWEVLTHTGKSLFDWQEETQPTPPTPWSFKVAALAPDREENYARVDQRFLDMMEEGDGHAVFDEVRAVMEQGLDPSLPVMRAHGVPEIIAYLRDQMALDEAIRIAQRNTRHYVKRQHTWLKHQLQADITIDMVINQKNIKDAVESICAVL